MGTSNLYGGPKVSSLLPKGYASDDNQGQGAASDNIPEGDMPEQENPENGQPFAPIVEPSVSWSQARSSISKAVRNRTANNIKTAISNYTKALGGHTNATRQAVKVRNTAGILYSLFSGTPETVKKKLEEAGVRFEGRTTNDVFREICNLIAPIPNDLEDSLVNNALQKTFSDIIVNNDVDLDLLDSFSEELLQKLVGGLLKHYIFDKLIMQSGQTALTRCDNVESLRNLEKAIKKYIDGIVDGVVPDLVRSGINPTDFNRAIEALVDVSYQQMEEL